MPRIWVTVLVLAALDQICSTKREPSARHRSAGECAAIRINFIKYELVVFVEGKTSLVPDYLLVYYRTKRFIGNSLWLFLI